MAINRNLSVHNSSNWQRYDMGKDNFIYEKPLDPQIIAAMPNEIDTYIDVGVFKLTGKRINTLIRTILKFLR